MRSDSRCSAVRSVSSSKLGHADDAVHRRADFVAHVGEELALDAVRLLGLLPRLIELARLLLQPDHRLAREPDRGDHPRAQRSAVRAVSAMYRLRRTESAA